jgi:hypothetical protein
MLLLIELPSLRLQTGHRPRVLLRLWTVLARIA